MRPMAQNDKKSSVWVIRCPECHTAFRITRQHLNAANGAVRCGNCLHVFKAMQNVITNKPRPFKAGSQNRHGPIPSHTKANRSVRSNKPAQTKSHSSKSTGQHRQTTASVKKKPKHASVTAVANESLELHYAPPKHLLQKFLLQDTWWRNGTTQQRSMLTGTAIALVLLLFVQNMLFNHDSPHSFARATAKSFCTILGCQLPKLIDRDQLEINNVIVRNDSDYVNGLIVDAIITNRASFAQPYPSLWLRVESTDGGIVGSRLLAPEQYLAGEASGEIDMPPENPVHLSLKILKPQDNAHKISFTFAE